MNGRINIILILTIMLGCKENVIEENKRDFFLFIGQSNMAGRGELIESDYEPNQKIYVFDGDKWINGIHPYNQYSNIRKKIDLQKYSMIESFAENLFFFEPHKNGVNVIVNARGGSSIDEWQPGEEYYEKTIQVLKKALKNGKCLGILWHQGESDRFKSSNYLVKLNVMINGIRSIANQDIPLIVGQIPNWKGNSNEFNNMILNASDFISKCKVVILPEDAEHIGDTIHFNRKTLINIGLKYADKYTSF
jgi:hypothetical protein